MNSIRDGTLIMELCRGKKRNSYIFVFLSVYLPLLGRNRSSTECSEL